MTSLHLFRRGAAIAMLAGVAVAVASCSSGPAAPGGASGVSPDTRLNEAGATLLRQMAAYQQVTQHCASKPTPVVCVEAADRTLGGQVHAYGNLLALGHGFTAPAADLTSARNSAQTLANSLEILGDAEPNQANYNQVLNTFDLNGAIGQLKSGVTTLHAHLGG